MRRGKNVNHPDRRDPGPAFLDDVVERITAGANGDDETLRAWHQALEDHITVPCDAFVIGEPISVVVGRRQ